MTKNLAIIVGVTDYVEEKLRLPASENDVSIMRELLLGSGKFNDVIVVQSQDAQALKAEVASFVGRFQHDSIGDLFFYFTGHGEFVDDEFRFMLRDYSSERPAQTSLENSELDRLLRSLSPALVVKVVDACYSGMPYIKDGSTVADQMMAQSQNVFSKCYFLFSSQNDQRSWASSNISDFTRAFVTTIANSSREAIRYKDVVDGLSDAFRNTPRQRPLFVIQGDYTEAFGTFLDSTRSRLKVRLESFDDVRDVPEAVAVAKSSLADLARAQAVDYVSMDKAIEAVAAIKHALDAADLQTELGDLFALHKEYSEAYEMVPAISSLGQWLTKNDDDFFANPTYEVEKYEVDSPLSSFFVLNGGDAKKVTKTRKVISGVVTKVSNLPFQSIRIELRPLLPNLTQYNGWLTFMLSKRMLQIFFCFAECKEIAWDKYRYSNPTEWQSLAYSLAGFEGGTPIVQNFMGELQRYVRACVVAHLGVNAEVDPSVPTT